MTWNIVVIDDPCRFPLHVWRYVSHSLGFGVGRVGPEGVLEREDSAQETWISEDEPLLTGDGWARLWWVRAGNDWLDGVRRVVTRLHSEDQLLFLVDIHGERGSRYSAKEVCDELKNITLESFWHPVSAYYSGKEISGKEILPKSRETLKKIRSYVYPSEERKRTDPKGVQHILITGAGFEVRSDHGGFGVPRTHELLEEMEEPFCKGESGKRDSIRLQTSTVGLFPVPDGGIWGDERRRDPIKDAAEAEDLDDYWDVLLEEELQSKIGAAKHETRGSRKARALIHETRMREAFRRSLLDHDWGHMGQSIVAAGLGWHAWLTTNYTQFANRAIALAGGVGGVGPWRIVSTAAEARVTMREEAWTTDKLSGASKEKELPNQYLFKLHGDIGHLHTMAIAGHDKDTFSPLSMPMDDLYQVYASAQRFLLDSLDGSETGLVMWHIVGHGLQDKRLCDLIGRVSRQSRSKHRFLLVNRRPEGPANRLKGALEGKPKIWSCPLYAADYMARLESDGLPSSEQLPAWLEKMAGLRTDTGEKAVVKE